MTMSTDLFLFLVAYGVIGGFFRLGFVLHSVLHDCYGLGSLVKKGKLGYLSGLVGLFCLPRIFWIGRLGCSLRFNHDVPAVLLPRHGIRMLL